MIAAYLLLHKLVIPGTIKQTADFGGGRDAANVEERKRERCEGRRGIPSTEGALRNSCQTDE